MALESSSSRPISVDLPSSTERRWRTAAGPWTAQPSEVALSLAVLHGGLTEAVVTTGGAALGDPRDGDLVDDLGDGRCLGLHAAGERQVPDGAEPYGALLDHLA